MEAISGDDIVPASPRTLERYGIKLEDHLTTDSERRLSVEARRQRGRDGSF